MFPRAANVRYTTSFYDQGDPLAAPGQHLHLNMSHSSELAWMPGSHHCKSVNYPKNENEKNGNFRSYVYERSDLYVLNVHFETSSLFFLFLCDHSGSVGVDS